MEERNENSGGAIINIVLNSMLVLKKVRTEINETEMGGWASLDGTINCIEQAYNFEGERFLVSLLKREAQHTVDMKQFSNITPAELKYRAKLVELHYANGLALLQKFLSQTDESRESDSHAAASARIKREFADTNQTQLSCIQTWALDLLHAHTKKMEDKYGGQRIG